MRQKTIKVPIYPCKLVLHECKDCKELEKKYDLGDCSGIEAVVFTRGGVVVIAFFKPVTHGIIAHEALHATSDIFNFICAEMDVNNQEPQCYLIEWIVEQCHKFLNEIK